MANILGFTPSVEANREKVEAILNNAGHQLVLGQSYSGAPNDDAMTELIINSMQGMAGVILGGAYFNRRAMEALPELRVIARAGVGYDAIDLEASRDNDVVVTITPTANADSVAEFAVLLTMALSRRLFANHRNVSDGNWVRAMGCDVGGKTIGIAGLGRIGRAVATRAKVLKMDIVAHELYPDRDFVQDLGIELVEFDELCQRADFISLHMPNTDETQHCINSSTLGLMKPTAYLINTARGGLVNESDLVDALNSGQIAGAGLDVFEEEPVGADSPLLKMPNVIVAPHVAGVTVESVERMAIEAAEMVVKVLAGDWPRNAVVNGIYSD